MASDCFWLLPPLRAHERPGEMANGAEGRECFSYLTRIAWPFACPLLSLSLGHRLAIA